MKQSGLSSEEVKKLQVRYGKNLLPGRKTASAVGLFLSQLKNPLVYLIFFVGLISVFLQRYSDAILVFSTVLVNSIFGFFQEYKAQKSLAALREIIKPLANVIRNGQRLKILAAELVPGDIVVLAEGDLIPADGVLIEAVSLLVNEAILTGESEAVGKMVGGEALMGTTVVAGRGIMRVIKISLATKIGEIAIVLKKTTQPLTVLQLRLHQFTNSVVYLSLFIALAIFVIGILRGKETIQMLQMAAVTIVSVIPEALVIVVTLILAIGMQRILKRQALIRKILAVESLGSVTVICTDKTGTLTEGKMVVQEEYFKEREKSLQIMCLCNDLSRSIEVAMWDYLKKQKYFDPQELFEKYPRLFEIPFSSDYKFMVTVNCLSSQENGECNLLVKGAAEIILEKCKNISAKEAAEIKNKIEAWGRRGLKVFGLAYRKLKDGEWRAYSAQKIPTLHWAGLVGLWDPPRREVKDALTLVNQAGVAVKVVTGDYRFTAEKIMDSLNMKVGPEEIMEGQELEKLSDEELERRIPRTLLFARVTPGQKLKIVKILQELGEVVAMTGDGVNDAPALKRSNIGIVVGTASDVAKETADMVLLDSNFKTIVAAIEEGRVIFENIKKTIFFILSNSFAEAFLIMGAIIMGWPLPLTIAQILWLHFLCDGPEDIVLGFEPKEREVMAEGPKKLSDPLLDKPRKLLIVAVSALLGATSLALFWAYGIRDGDIALGRTVAFMAISLSTVFYIFSCRSFRKPFWRYENFWKNPALFAAMAFSLFLQVSIDYIPVTQRLLEIVPLNFWQWLLVAGIGMSLVVLIEGVKVLVVRTKNMEHRT